MLNSLVALLVVCFLLYPHWKPFPKHILCYHLPKELQRDPLCCVPMFLFQQLPGAWLWEGPEADAGSRGGARLVSVVCSGSRRAKWSGLCRPPLIPTSRWYLQWNDLLHFACISSLTHTKKPIAFTLTKTYLANKTISESSFVSIIIPPVGVKINGGNSL